MEKLKFNVFNVKNYEFLVFSYNTAKFVFSTAKGDLNFHKKSLSKEKNFNILKKHFKLNEISYLNQIHSDVIYNYNGKIEEGDALITNKSNLGIGVFTADCVPVLILDSKKNIIAAVHSGWKGTLNCIVLKTLDKMIRDFDCNTENIIAVIGPHIGDCCYEVGEEVINKFKNCELYKNQNIFKGNKLSMEKCIIRQLNYKNVNKIKTLNICTFCNKEYNLYSYRKNKDGKRMFSFIYFK
ncbi:laccase domain protein YfiH [Clostridium acetireducens DSM 10703]|jgi:YfiH family protein|uniref:Purine nucleoside phosphorylase n=1 Tax=Clostridium acetireducens DSM 10703 TaxID=1121290 RepID=A0A1E8EXD6_9CLOT|nr:peptidoglycan editing factor PgeF [Clostridium acetireducens]OFI05442.1 laccase domain protein YfiH [Clostridium acetireducens DSM 10703]